MTKDQALNLTVKLIRELRGSSWTDLEIATRLLDELGMEFDVIEPVVETVEVAEEFEEEIIEEVVNDLFEEEDEENGND